MFSLSSAEGQRAEDIIFTPEKVKTIPGHGMSQGEYPFEESGKYRTDWVNPSAKSKTKYSVTVRSPISPNSKEHSNYALKNPGRNATKKPSTSTPRSTEIASQTHIERRASSRNTPPKTLPKKAPEIRVPAIKPTPPPPAIRLMSDAEAKSQGFIGPYTEMISRGRNIASAQPPRRPAHVPQHRPQFARPKPALPPTPTAPAKPIYHKVDAGDTLFGISKKYGVSVDSLKRTNGLTSDLIKVGQSLRLALAQKALEMTR